MTFGTLVRLDVDSCIIGFMYDYIRRETEFCVYALIWSVSCPRHIASKQCYYMILLEWSPVKKSFYLVLLHLLSCFRISCIYEVDSEFCLPVVYYGSRKQTHTFRFNCALREHLGYWIHTSGTDKAPTTNADDGIWTFQKPREEITGSLWFAHVVQSIEPYTATRNEQRTPTPEEK